MTVPANLAAPLLIPKRTDNGAAAVAMFFRMFIVKVPK